MIEILIVAIVILVGMIFGSFISCVSYRLPLEIDVIKKPSFCPNCNHKLGFKDLFPVFSWMLSGGKCRHCSVKISARYPLIELITGAIFALLYLKYGLTWQAVILAGMVVALLVMIVADMEHFIIPDCVHVSLVPLAIAYRFVNGTFSPDILWSFGLMTAIALLLHYGYSAMRGRAMLGYGDVKFFAVVGLWLDIHQIPLFLLLSGVFGVVFGLVWQLLGKGKLFPFGPALAVALLICLLSIKTIYI